MKWYFRVLGGHTHVQVYMNSGWCGDLCFRNEEFREIRANCPWIEFIREGHPTLEEIEALAKQLGKFLREHPELIISDKTKQDP